MSLRVLALPLAATSVAAAVTAFVWMLRGRASQRSEGQHSDGRRRESQPPASEVDAVPATVRLAHDDGDEAPALVEAVPSTTATRATPSRSENREPRPLTSPATLDDCSIFDTAEPDSLRSVDSAEASLDRESYPIDVDNLGTNWLARATQASPQAARSEMPPEPEEDHFPTLEPDELSDAVESREPDSEWLRAREAIDRKDRDSGEQS